MILRTGEELLGMTYGRRPPNGKESGWWKLTPKKRSKGKKEAGIAYDANKSEENRLAWRNANKEANKETYK